MTRASLWERRDFTATSYRIAHILSGIDQNPSMMMMMMVNILSCSSLLVYVQIWTRMSVYGFEAFHARTVTSSSTGNNGRIATRNTGYERCSNGNDPMSSTHLENQAASMERMYSDLLPNPNPTFQAIDVVTACMDTFLQNPHDTKIGLDVCFAFSNDRCRAAIGGNINEFYQYATNPTFAYLTSSVSYQVVSIGPTINGTAHRGAMQTVLLEVIPSITTSMTTSTSTIPSPNVKYSTRTDQRIKCASVNTNDDDDKTLDRTSPTPRRFLWTLQQERRPPLQNCWMIHEVLYTKNAFQQTM